jgi:RND family efflux transporter MFP subunit
VVRPAPETGVRHLILPGDVEAFYQTPIYARVSGYLKMWDKDIGAQVKAGDLLAVIETPDLDQQVMQAKASLASAQADLTLAEITARRWKALLASNSVSQQTADEKSGHALAAAGQVQAARANLDRLNALESFKRIVAPFDGVVTARRTDVGALINAGSGTGPELFAVADVHEMRIYVRVPQAQSASIQPGMQASLRLPQYPGRAIPATVVTTSGAVDMASRTMLVELRADNRDGSLLPGTYADVDFELRRDHGVLELPSSALIFQAAGLQVAVVDGRGKVALRDVKIGRDMGSKVEIVAGLAASDSVIDNPPDSLSPDETVRIADAHPEHQAAATGGHGPAVTP